VSTGWLKLVPRERKVREGGERRDGMIKIVSNRKFGEKGREVVNFFVKKIA
jgi:hypothetical protein